jgi:hypothetical protein
MKSAYEIAWDLMPHHLNRNPVDVSVLLDKLSDLTGVSMTELLKMRHKHEIVTALAPYKDRIALLREVIEELAERRPHYPVIKEASSAISKSLPEPTQKGLVQYIAPMPVQILHFMKTIKNPCSIREFADWRAVTEIQRKELSGKFVKLVERGEIKRIKNGVYELVNHV